MLLKLTTFHRDAIQIRVHVFAENSASILVHTEAAVDASVNRALSTFGPLAIIYLQLPGNALNGSEKTVSVA